MPKEPRKKIKLTIPIEVLCDVGETRKRHQSVSNRIVELVVKGLEKQRADYDAKQLEELIKEGKITADIGAVKKC
jgi:hypothetical protein